MTDGFRGSPRGSAEVNYADRLGNSVYLNWIAFLYFGNPVIGRRYKIYET